MLGCLRPLLFILAACVMLAACGGPMERPAKQASPGASLLRLAAMKLGAPQYHKPAGRWRAEHGGLVAVNGTTQGAGFELGECLLCHRTKGCNACHAYAGARRLPKEARP